MRTVREATAEEAGRLNRRAAIASVSFALVLLLSKFWAVWATGSVAMLGSAADTALDLAASVMTLISVSIAALPADDDHRFGHGKAEAIAALLQVVLISLSSVGLLIESIRRWSRGSEPSAIEGGVLISGMAMICTCALLVYQRRVIARTASVAIGTDYVHYQSDLLLNAAVIIALIANKLTGALWVDPAFGVAIALWLAWGAVRASMQAIDQLMDREWPEDRRARLIEIAASHRDFDGLHELKTRTSGAHDFVQFHIWVDPGLTIAQAHELVVQLEGEIAAEFPGTEVLIHVDPRGYDRPGDYFEPVPTGREHPGARPGNCEKPDNG